MLSSFHLREFNRNVKLFFLYGISINAGMALFTLLYNLYLLRLSYQEDFIGQVAGMAPLATGLLALPIGMLSDRLGRKPFLVASSLLLAVSQLGLCLSTTPVALLAFSFLGGVATAFIWVNHVPFLSDNASVSRRAEALVLWSALQVAVRMLWSLVGGFLPGFMGSLLDVSTELPEPFRYSLFLGVALSLIAVLPLLRMPGHAGRNSPGKEVDTRADDTSASPWPTFIGIAALSGSRGFSMGLTFPFFNVFFEEELHVGATAIGAIFFLSQLVGLPATFTAPALVRRFGATLTILPARTVGGLALGVMGTVINLPVAVLMFLLSRAAEVVDNPSDQHFSTQILPRRYWARIQGFRVCGFQLFNFAGSVLGGLLILDYGYGAAFGLACMARIASGLIMAGWFGLRPKTG
ncbi:MAG TPA: MFS transporter [Candidatus Latescibacteria bacterium]|nr:MFS transporter [Candidatus Latescibacterota bacterium]HJP30537.1 MFS transporter [Candidatus Latescibacterota bacterium]